MLRPPTPERVPFLPRLVLMLGTVMATCALAGERTDSKRSDERQTEFADLSIEELANIDVTSVSKRHERLQDAPASVFVITADDIRRAGSRSLPEALRLAPNLEVARANNTGYYISARGMNGTSNSPANKLLVMIDGRSVYSPLFSGVFWDEPDVMLEDVERIEVISGPGGTLWGVNAVSGVINITTRHAAETQGDLLVLRGDSDGAQAAFRHAPAAPTIAGASTARCSGSGAASCVPANPSTMPGTRGRSAFAATGSAAATASA